MPYAWKPNRDSGSVRSHRNPDTKRRYPRSEIGMMFKAHNGRASMNAALYRSMPELKTGLYDLSIAKVRRGWDAGDPLSRSVILVEAIGFDELEWLEDETVIEDWMWECSCGDPFCEYA